MVSVIFHFSDREPLAVEFASMEELKADLDITSVTPEQDSILSVKQAVYEAGEIIEYITYIFNQKNLVYFLLQENVAPSAHEKMLISEGFVPN